MAGNTGYVGNKAGSPGGGYSGVSNEQKQRAAGRRGTDTPAQNTNKAARNHTNQSRRKGGNK